MNTSSQPSSKHVRALPMPSGPDKIERKAKRLAQMRKHHRKWPEPFDAKLVLNLHFSAHSFGRGSHSADATLEIPTAEGFQYYTVSRGGKTKYAAMTSLIQEIESSNWFQYMKTQAVYFQITGDLMESLYRGYL